MSVHQITKFKKRDGRIIDFNTERIRNAIIKAFNSNLQEKDIDLIVSNVLDKCNYFDSEILEIEDVQNNIVTVLIEMKYTEEAMAYLEYKKNRSKVRKQKLGLLGKKSLDEVDKTFSFSALRILAQRCLLRNPDNEIIETPKQMFQRVAVAGGITSILYDPRVYSKKKGKVKIIQERLQKYNAYLDLIRKGIDSMNYADTIKDGHGTVKIGEWIVNVYHQERLLDKYIDLYKEGMIKIDYLVLLEMMQKGEFKDTEKFISDVYELMVNRKLLPNSPMLMNGGAKLGNGSACYVLPVDDDIHSIMKTATDCADVFKAGGGVGINYSNIRPNGAVVASTSGVASGPISFMRIIDTVTDVVKQAGKRRGANMGIVDINSPDIEEFIMMKSTPKVFENFNVSVGIWGEFMDALYENKDYFLSHPKDTRVKKVSPKTLIDLIAFSAWKSAEPGVLFYDNMNKHNTLLPAFNKPLKDSNPCSEIIMYPYESCILCSIALPYFITDKKTFDWDEYSRVCKIATQFMDNIIDYNKFIPEIKDMTNKVRRIGVGTMGIADMLQLLKIPYNSKEGYQLMADVMENLTYYTELTSCHLGAVRGNFPLFDKSTYKEGKLPVDFSKSGLDLDWKGLSQLSRKYKRNGGATSTNAPTGTLSMLADVSNGIEPVFSNAYEKRITVGRFFYVNKNLEKWLKDNKLYTDEILEKISNNYGSVKGITEIPQDIRDVFCTAMDIHWVDHIMALAAFTKWTGNSSSKTCNLSENATVSHIRGAYLLSHEFGVKGCSVYRDGSRDQQVLHVGAKSKNLMEIMPSGAALLYIQEHLDKMQESPRKRYFINTLKECGFEIVDNQVIYKDSKPDDYGFYNHGDIVVPVVKTQSTLIKTIGAPCIKSDCQGKLTPNGKCLICNICGTTTSCNI